MAESRSQPRKHTVLAWAILGYLDGHPDAKDVPAGVKKWWLKPEGVDAEMDRVAEALDYLVERGWLTCAVAPPNLRLYSLNKDRHTALKQLQRVWGLT